MRVNRVVEVVPVKAVVNELDEESMDDGSGYGLEADEWVVQDWEKGEKELAEARDEEVSEYEMKAITSESTKCGREEDER